MELRRSSSDLSNRRRWRPSRRATRPAAATPTCWLHHYRTRPPARLLLRRPLRQCFSNSNNRNSSSIRATVSTATATRRPTPPPPLPPPAEALAARPPTGTSSVPAATRPTSSSRHRCRTTALTNSSNNNRRGAAAATPTRITVKPKRRQYTTSLEIHLEKRFWNGWGSLFSTWTYSKELYRGSIKVGQTRTVF